ncbi:MAG: DUF3501 family protein [Bdellovibrio sp.]|nr:DUF3501 family protein [Bdellovibrio sp.]
MRKLERYDIMDYMLYEEKRSELRHHIAKMKEPRRIFLGDQLLFIFENTEMVRDHVLETIRIDKLFSEHDLLRQLEIFNPLLANAGELRCTMIVLGTSDWDGPKRVKPLKELSVHIYLILNDGRKVYAQAPETASINQYPGTLKVLNFICGNNYPVLIGSDHREYKLEKKLSPLQQNALREDLESTSNVIHRDLH